MPVRVVRMWRCLMNRTWNAFAGRRSGALITIGGLFVLMGMIVLTEKSPINLGETILYEPFPLWLRVSGWVASGLVAVLCAFRVRWQDWGYRALFLMPAERLFSHSWAGWHSVWPGGLPGQGWAALWAVCLWAGIVWHLYRLAGWSEDVVAKPAEE